MTRLLLAFAVMLPSIALAQSSSDDTAEQKILLMLNQVRIDSSLQVLKTDSRLDSAAGMHLLEFGKSGEIADQYEGEITLVERLKMAHVSFGSAAEVMFKVANVEEIAPQLKNSDSARRILLNAKFSAAGIAQMSDGSHLFVVVNLVQPLDTLSPEEVENLVVEAAQHARANHKLLPFRALPMHRLRGMACDMSKKDSLKVAPLDASVEYGNALSTLGQTVVFTTRDPRIMPASVQAVGFDPKVNVVSAGVCFGRSPAHPDGTYWVALMFWAQR